MSEKRSTQTGRTPVRMMTRPELASRLEQADLSPLEERVIRMRYGLTVADDHPVGGPLMTLDPTAQAQVAEFEVRALKALIDQGTISEEDLLVAQLKSLGD